jgi:Cof subfamily protein (haloacid dehalogenase superfamily)
LRPRLVATDLDGTLLRPDATVSPRVAAALRAAQDAGIAVVVLTARSWRSLGVLPRELFPQGVAICSNGAVVYDLARDEVVRSHHFEPEVLRAFLDRVHATLDAAVAWETPSRAYRTRPYQELCDDTYASPAYLAAVEIADDLRDDHLVTKLLVRHKTMRADELLTALTPIADPVTLTISGGVFVECMAPGITKAAALASLCDELGIRADEVIAVGDHTNDLPMLEWAGRGVAMGNAHPSVLEQVAEHTSTNVDDGLAVVIEGLLCQD